MAGTTKDTTGDAKENEKTTKVNEPVKETFELHSEVEAPAVTESKPESTTATSNSVEVDAVEDQPDKALPMLGFSYFFWIFEVERKFSFFH